MALSPEEGAAAGDELAAELARMGVDSATAATAVDQATRTHAELREAEWSRFEDWCDDQDDDIDSLPAGPADIARYLESLPSRSRRFAADVIAAHHVDAGHPDPTG